MVKIYQFCEHSLTVSGEEADLRYLAELLRNAEGTAGDLRYQIEYAFDIGGIRSSNTEIEDCTDPNYMDQYLKAQ